MSDTIKAPWTTEQVQALNDYQFLGIFHEYTCRDSWHRPLVASHDGWFCLDCDYTQDWAHRASAEWRNEVNEEWVQGTLWTLPEA